MSSLTALKILLPFLMIFLSNLPTGNMQQLHYRMLGQAEGVPAPGSALVAGASDSGEGLAGGSSAVVEYAPNTPTQEFPFAHYVTPNDESVRALSASIEDPEDAYKEAVRWVYVSDDGLNHSADRWLTPAEFLVDTPRYFDNPLMGSPVSDCEEQANTLVSLLRAQGMGPEEVRVTVGKVMFNSRPTGHVWAEVLRDGRWMVLDPTWGPYWDGGKQKLVKRNGVPFDYYLSHEYPVLNVWVYYNDIYFLNPVAGSGDAPESWAGKADASE
jgi:hypothetical protein